MGKAFIACGGTGGHLSPGIALAEELIAQNWTCTLLISSKQVDSRLVSKYSQFEYETLAGSAFSLEPVALAKFMVNLARGTARCLSRLQREKPDVVIGFGGFLTLPAMLAALIVGLPTVVHEANRVPGRVTRIVSLFARRIYLPKGVSLRTKRSSRIRHLGMPVRREIKQLPKHNAKISLGLNPEQRVLLVMGGSQGAEALNEWVKENLASLAQKEIQVLCLTGGAGADTFVFSFGTGHDRVADYVSGTDSLAFESGLTYAAAESNGNTILSLSDGGSVTLVGVPASEFIALQGWDLAN